MGTAGIIGISGTDGYRAGVTSDGYLDVKTHSSNDCFGGDYAEAQTATAIITPSSGKRLLIKQVYVSTETETTDVTLEFATSEKTIFKLYTGKKQAHTGNIICGEGAADEALSLTCGVKTFVSVAYDEID